MDADRRERVFLVRLWREPGGAVDSAWRGSVADVSCGGKRYITVPQEIADFVTLRLSATDVADQTPP